MGSKEIKKENRQVLLQVAAEEALRQHNLKVAEEGREDPNVFSGQDLQEMALCMKVVILERFRVDADIELTTGDDGVPEIRIHKMERMTDEEDNKNQEG